MRLTLCLLLLGLTAFVMVNAAASQREAENSVSRETRNARKQVDKKTKKGRKLRRNKAGRRNRHPKRKSRKAKKSLKRTRKNGQRRSRPGWRVVKPASAALRATARQNGKLVGAKCSYIIFENILTNGNGCKTGDKFVLKAESGSRRQFLIVSNKIILAFVSNAAGEKKFTDCATITDVTAQLTCKAVDGVADLVVVEGGSSGNGGGAATAAATTSAAATTAAPDRRTYLAALTYSFSEAELSSPYCAGSLISSQWILTSAACSLSDTSKIDKAKVSIVFGEDTLGSTSSPLYKVVSVSKIFYPSSFALENKADNVAVWKLAEPLDTAVYKPLCLPKEDSDQGGSQAKLVGWRLADSPALSEEAVEQSVKLTASDASSCPSNFLCSRSISPCQGDYGAPLVLSKSLIGVVSRGNICSSTDMATFTQISKHVSWIKSTINDNGGGDIC